MELVEFGPDDTAHLEAYLAVRNACDAVDAPWEQRLTAYRQAMYMRHSWEGEPGRWFVAYDGGRPIGAGAIDVSDYDNRDLAWFSVLVAPSCRRRGHGVAILRRLETLAAEMGRTLLGIDGWDDASTRGFAAAAGYEHRSSSVRRLLLLADAPDPGSVRAEALGRAGDYELQRIDGYTPDDLLPALVTLTEAINDAPLDDLEYEDEVYSVERIRAYERAQIEAGFRLRRILARHRATGDLAAHTVAEIDAEEPAIGHQHDTSVLRAHRGHRLGLLLKSEMLLWLKDEEPQLELIYTYNAESNAHMIDVNDRLGYRPVGRNLEFQRRIR